MCEANPTIFKHLNENAAEPEITEIESLCVNCQKNGVTKILLTKIPFYRDVIVMSFTCDVCGYENNEIQSGGTIAEQGVRIVLDVISERDINRQVVKSDYTSVKIVDIDFEIPAKSQKGEVTTVEGIIKRSIVGLSQDQERRRLNDTILANKIDTCIQQLEQLLDPQLHFTLMIEDISGNSFVENPNAPHVDENCKISFFTRTTEQDHELGIFTQQEVESNTNSQPMLDKSSSSDLYENTLHAEVLQFQTNCPNCTAPCETNMKVTKIPHFKEVVIMATICETCGHRTNEVKSGSGIEPKGVRFTLKISEQNDFNRDVLKSETCSVSIPELDLEVGPRALGGKFTTVEGVLVDIKNQLSDSTNTQLFGDSQTSESKNRMKTFLEHMDTVLAGKRNVTLILDDPAGNSYLETIEIGGCDTSLKAEHYERTFDQNEELGINDMKTENYEQD